MRGGLLMGRGVQCKELVTRELERIKDYATKLNISFSWDDAAVVMLSQALDTNYGARSLKNEVSRRVVDRLADMSLENRITAGSGVVLTGVTVSCPGATFVMTTNVGADQIASHTGELDEEFKKLVMYPLLKGAFRRNEFLGRINEIVYFLPFSRVQCKELVTRELERIKDYATKLNISFSWDDAAVVMLSQALDTNYGARSLKNEVSRRVVDRLADMSLENRITAGSGVVLTVRDDVLSFDVNHLRNVRCGQWEWDAAGDMERKVSALPRFCLIRNYHGNYGYRTTHLGNHGYHTTLVTVVTWLPLTTTHLGIFHPRSRDKKKDIKMCSVFALVGVDRNLIPAPTPTNAKTRHRLRLKLFFGDQGPLGLPIDELLLFGVFMSVFSGCLSNVPSTIMIMGGQDDNLTTLNVLAGFIIVLGIFSSSRTWYTRVSFRYYDSPKTSSNFERSDLCNLMSSFAGTRQSGVTRPNWAHFCPQVSRITCLTGGNQPPVMCYTDSVIGAKRGKFELSTSSGCRDLSAQRAKYSLLLTLCRFEQSQSFKNTQPRSEPTNQNSLFRSRDWLSANQGPVFPDSVWVDTTYLIYFRGRFSDTCTTSHHGATDSDCNRYTGIPL
eukprot:sb/3463107/